ncbi:MAG: hypothetical protein RL519_213, partial [Pseudomonadota bacterium]
MFSSHALPMPAMSNSAADLPSELADWFARRGWQLRRHQREMLAIAGEGRHAL